MLVDDVRPAGRHDIPMSSNRTIVKAVHITLPFKPYINSCRTTNLGRHFTFLFFLGCQRLLPDDLVLTTFINILFIFFSAVQLYMSLLFLQVSGFPSRGLVISPSQSMSIRESPVEIRHIRTQSLHVRSVRNDLKMK